MSGAIAVAQISPSFQHEALNLIFRDRFTDTNGTSLANHTPEKNTGTAGWSVAVGTATVDSNAADVGTATPDIAVVTLGVANYTVRCLMTLNAANRFGVILRYATTTSFVFIEGSGDVNQLQLRTRDAAGYNTISQTTFTWSGAVQLVARLDGSSVSATIGGTTLTGTITEAQTAGGVGIWAWSGDTADWDDLEVWK